MKSCKSQAICGLLVLAVPLSVAAQEASPGAAPSASGGGSLSTEGMQFGADGFAEDEASGGTPAERGFLELGIFGGVFLPSPDHNFRDAKSTEPPVPYNDVAPDFGLRVGWYPLSFLGVEAEGAAIPTETEDGGAALLVAARGQAVLQYPGEYVLPFLAVGAGAIFSDSDANGTDRDGAFHFGVGAKVPITNAFDVRLDVRDNITNRYGDDGDLPHHPEALLGLTWVIGGKDAQPPLPPPPDTDGDGLIDAEDACPNIPGEDGKGCPWGDKDADNIKDNVDKCPDVAGIEPDGCPDPDPDKDGILAPADQCPDVAGVAPDGCPDTDPDKDGIPSDVDKCPDQPETVNGFEDADGCPDEVPEEVKKFTGVIEGIYFDLGKATIRARSHQVLNAAVKLLGDYPSLKLRISGHTDSTGTRERNLDLSAERAESVKTYMVEQGVDASRLETVGVGPDKPIGDNKTKQGRAENRRIEFEVIK